MNPIFVPLAALAGVIISVTVSYLLSARQTRQQIKNFERELQHRYISKLYEKRLEAYPKLYRITNDLTRLMRAEELSPEKIRLAFNQFCEWDRDNAIFVSALTLRSLIRFRKFLERHAGSGSEYLKQSKVKGEILSEAIALEATLKTELGIFSIEDFHNPARIQSMGQVIRSLQEAHEDG
jgi:hypothetical protein